MKLRTLPSSWIAIACMAAVACSSNSGAVPTTPSDRTGQVFQNGFGDGPGAGGSPSPAPTATPDAMSENACGLAGGGFIDLVGDAGVDCAGGPNGPTAIYGSRCGIRYSIYSKGHSSAVMPDGTGYEDFSGLRIFGDCSYQVFF